MNRLHPQDLRAIMAALLFERGPYTPAGAVFRTDALLAELERTAKPEAPAPKPACPKCSGKGKLPVDVGHSWPCDC